MESEELEKEVTENVENVENVEEVIEENSDKSEIKIADDVVSVIAGIAASEVSGVSGMAGGFAGGLSKGIKVEVGNKEAKIDVNIIVEYGVRIPDVAFEIQNRVKKAVETMTGLKVLEVNVHVQGVNTDINETEDKKEVNTEIMNETENLENK